MPSVVRKKKLPPANNLSPLPHPVIALPGRGALFFVPALGQESKRFVLRKCFSAAIKLKRFPPEGSSGIGEALGLGEPSRSTSHINRIGLKYCGIYGRRRGFSCWSRRSPDAAPNLVLAFEGALQRQRRVESSMTPSNRFLFSIPNLEAIQIFGSNGNAGGIKTMIGPGRGAAIRRRELEVDLAASGSSGSLPNRSSRLGPMLPMLTS